MEQPQGESIGPTFDDLDGLLCEAIYAFLDTKSAYSFAVAGQLNKVVSATVSSALGKELPDGVTLSGNRPRVRLVRGCFVIMDDGLPGVAGGTASPGEPEKNKTTWETKRTIVENIVPYPRWVPSDEHLRVRVRDWLGTAGIHCSVGIDTVVQFLEGFCRTVLLHQEQERRGATMLADIQRAAEYLNLRVASPLLSEMTFDVQFLNDRCVKATLSELATADFRLADGSFMETFQLETMTLAEQLGSAEDNLRCHLEHCSLDHASQDLKLDMNLTKVGEIPNHVKTDSEWEDLLPLLDEYKNSLGGFYAQESLRRSKEEVDEVYSELRSNLVTFLTSLPSLAVAPSEPSVDGVQPSLQLSSETLRNIWSEFANAFLPFQYTRSHVSHSALNLIHLIVEDLIFGRTMRPFAVKRPENIYGARPSRRCDFLIGRHGTTFFGADSNSHLNDSYSEPSDEGDDSDDGEDSDYEMEDTDDDSRGEEQEGVSSDANMGNEADQFGVSADHEMEDENS